MKWIKATDRLPANNNMVHINYSTDKTKFMLTGYYDPIQHKWFRQSTNELDWAPNLEWLDEESNEPVFSLEDMRKCWEDGAFNGVCDYQENKSYKDAVTFKDFMKEEYKIDLP
jgi:hypothetical protein